LPKSLAYWKKIKSASSRLHKNCNKGLEHFRFVQVIREGRKGGA
jgi:hypothetical protein